MRRKRFLALSAFLALALWMGAVPSLADGGYSRIATIQFDPTDKPLASFDISWVDNHTQIYYLADRSNNRIDVVDARNNHRSVLGAGKFVGVRGSNDTSGPDGVLTIRKLNQLWVGDGDSRVLVFDLESGQLLDTISTAKPGVAHNPNRADELAFDADNGLIVIANDADDPPYLTFISTEDHSVQGFLDFPDALDGLEQPVWDRETGKILQAVPETTSHPGGEIAVIDPEEMTVEARYPLTDCNPHGLALGPHHQLLVGCASTKPAAKTVILDARTGATVASFAQIRGSDEVWFNPGDKRYYLAARNNPGGPVLGVIDARTNTWITNVKTGNGAHSVAANRANNHVFVPIGPDPSCPRGCIAVFARD